MAIKALKQNLSVCGMQKMIHQWKARGITESACFKLLDLYLGLPSYMTAEGTYPQNNYYLICQALKSTHTTLLLENVRKCGSFGLVWDATRTKLLAFYSPLWGQFLPSETTSETESVAGPASTVAEPASTVAGPATEDNSILYNINNNIYPPEDSRKESPSGKTENPSETPLPNPAEEFFHRLNANPDEKKMTLTPIIDCIAGRQNFTRQRALDTLVILVTQFLIPHFNSQASFVKTSHSGRIIWLKNLMKSRRGETLMQQAVLELSRKLQSGLEERRKKCREFRPVSPFEWKDADTDIRYYDDPMDGKVEIPKEAPPRPGETAIWNVLSCQWVN